MLAPYQPLQVNDQNLRLVQAEIAKTFAEITSCLLLTGVLVKVTLGASDTAVSHNLDSTNVNWLIGNLSANAAVWTGSTAPTKNAIFLRSSAACSALIYVFEGS